MPPSYIEIEISRDKDPYKATSIVEHHKGFDHCSSEFGSLTFCTQKWRWTEDDCPFQLDDFEIPCSFSGVYTTAGCLRPTGSLPEPRRQ